MKLRSIIFVITIISNQVFVAYTHAQSTEKAAPIKPINYNEWKEEAKTNIRLFPKYGNQAKTEQQKEADQKLISAYTQQYESRGKASQMMIKLGFDYLYRGDIKTAMYRFNQAWLLDSSNVDVYWGFGAVYFSLEQGDLAIAQYDEGLKVDPKNARLITDKATVYMMDYQVNNDTDKLKTAIDLF